MAILLAEREQQLTDMRGWMSDKRKELEQAAALLAEREQELNDVRGVLGAKKSDALRMQAALEAKEREIETFRLEHATRGSLDEKCVEVQRLKDELAERDRRVVAIECALREKEEELRRERAAAACAKSVGGGCLDCVEGFGVVEQLLERRMAR